ncbi:Replication protein A 70 kDa DNA-binding subunit [Abeliophyllum distichum]|uniref:Replication protein A 70 kDa DNA-binding subunit n=1 Tax=Abeliophyllum distichum TaxID=126358 RepID=A0ABD1W170_9LAMI
MAPTFSLVNEVNATKKNWALRVLVVRAYETSSRDNPDEKSTLEFVLQDMKGDRIHATVRQVLIETFEPLMKEGKLYAIRSFVVVSNNMMFKMTAHKYRIFIQSYTQVYEFSDETFPKKLYKFKPFEEIFKFTENDDTKLFDLIGEVVGREILRSKEVSNKQTYLMDIVVQDADFRLQLRVVDDTGNAAFLVWNHEVVDLLGKTVAELKAELHEGSSSNDEFITPLKSGCEISDSNNAYEEGFVKRALICDFSITANKKLRTVIKKEND